VVKTARDQGLGRAFEDEEIDAVVKNAMWEPRYAPYDPAPYPM
jgi:hypothetical protein